MSNYIKELCMLEELLIKQCCDAMLKTKNQLLRDEYLNMFDDVDDALLKLDKLVIFEDQKIPEDVSDLMLDELQVEIEDKLSKIRC